MRRALAHLVRALIALVAILATSSPAEAAAPMCGEDAVSIEAPPPIYPSDDGVLASCGETIEVDAHGLPLKSGETKLSHTTGLDLALLGEPLAIAPATRHDVFLSTDASAPSSAHPRAELRPPRS